jgi:hypothetical protein
MPALTLPAASPSEPAQSNFYPRPAAPRGQRHPGHDLYENNNDILARSGLFPDNSHSLPPQQHYAHSQPMMFSYLANTPNWYQPVHMMSQGPYTPPPPPQIAHKVWILDCKSCGTFLTNRGMKVRCCARVSPLLLEILTSAHLVALILSLGSSTSTSQCLSIFNRCPPNKLLSLYFQP